MLLSIVSRPLILKKLFGIQSGAEQASETATAAPSSQQGVSATANAGDSNNATLESIARELFPEWSAINVKSMAGRITGQLAS